MNKHWPYRKSKYSRRKRVKRDAPALGVEPLTFYRKEENEMRNFWDLVKESVIVQGIVTLVFVGTTCYLYATGQDVPNTLIQLDGIVVGFFFGAKAQQIAGR